MADELNLEGKLFISSKRAAELLAYTQDYVGQLARSGRVEAKRVAGLWYVNRDSIVAHKNSAEAYIPTPPEKNSEQVVDILRMPDGTEYVSARRASKLSGYSADYVGELARDGIIPAQRVANRWYVVLAALLDHKKTKDGLLAAVQAQSVGLSRSRDGNEDVYSESHFTYISQESTPLLPEVISDPSAADMEKDEDHDGSRPENTHIPIRVLRTSVPATRVAQRRGTYERNSSKLLLMSGITATVVLAAYFTWSTFSIQGRGDSQVASSASQSASSFTFLYALTHTDISFVRSSE